jgi:hypothetical protein
MSQLESPKTTLDAGNGKTPNVILAPDIQNNLGTRRIPPLRPSEFPDAGAACRR